MSATEVLRAYSRIGDSDPRRLIDEPGRLKLPHALDEDTAKAVKSIKLSRRQTGDPENPYENVIEYTFGIRLLHSIRLRSTMI
jgi:hypothetical protein